MGTANWEQTHGTDWADGEKASGVVRAADGGFVIAGTSSGDGFGNKTDYNYGSSDFWLVKLDQWGVKLWDHTFGGSGGEQAGRLIALDDGGVVVAGSSWSAVSGNKSSPRYGQLDGWAVRVAADGSKVWDVSFGGTGSGYQFFSGAVPAGDGGFLFYGSAFAAPSGNKSSPSYGQYDGWIVRVNSAGAKLWDASFGGAGQDFLNSVALLPDGGFILAGTSASPPGGNKGSLAYGQDDAWLVRVDANGNRMWDRTYGGAGNDMFLDVLVAEDGGFLVAGASASAPGANKTSPNLGGEDYWVLRLNANGDRIWENSYGGSGGDRAARLLPMSSGGFLIGGASYSSAASTKTSPDYGGADFWLVQTSADGSKQWEGTVGGDEDEFLTGMVTTSDGGILLGGYSWSNQSGTKTTYNYRYVTSDISYNTADYWVVKLLREPRPGWRYYTGVSSTDPITDGRYYDDYRLAQLASEREYAAVLQAILSNTGTRLRLYNAADRGTLGLVETSGDLSALVFTNRAGTPAGIELGGAVAGWAGSYYFGVYPTVRPGQSRIDTLQSNAPSTQAPGPIRSPTPPRPNSVFYYTDYFLTGLEPGEAVEVIVKSAAFDPYLELVDFRQPSGGITYDHNGAPGGGARLVVPPAPGTNRLIRVSSFLRDATGDFEIRLRPILPIGQRRKQNLAPGDLQASGRFYDEYTTDWRDLPADAEGAVYLRAAFEPVVQLRDSTTESLLREVVGTSTSALLPLTNGPGPSARIRLTSAGAALAGLYETAFYATMRPGRSLDGALMEADPSVTNRTLAGGNGRWYYDDYLLSGVQPGDRVTVQVEPSAFVPFLEIRLLEDESVQDSTFSSSIDVTVQGTGQDARDYLIRVTSRDSGALGSYTLRAAYSVPNPQIWSFSPGSGVPGKWVTVHGTNFIDGLQPLFDGVTVGGIGVASRGLKDMGPWQEFELRVESNARTGPIELWRDGKKVATSTSDLIVLAPIGGVRRELSGGISFGASNAVAGAVNVIEATLDLRPPIMWSRIATNAAAPAGVWRYTNANAGGQSQRFFRVRRE